MRFFTSSSSEPTPKSATQTLVAFALGFLLMAGALEIVHRSRGEMPSVSDDKALWSAERHRAKGDAIVVLGKSRIQMGLDPERLSELTKREVAFLPVHGSGAAAVLQDLAAEGFGGTVIFSAAEVDLTRHARDDQKAYVDHYESDRSIDRATHARVRAFFQERFAFLAKDLSIRHFIKYRFDRGEWPRPNFFRTRASRAQLAHFERADLTALKQAIGARRQNHDRMFVQSGGVKVGPWLREARELYPAFETLKKAGARVVLLKFPFCEEGAAYAERWYPRARFWNALAKEVPAETLHYEDIKGAQALDCPDTSHVAFSSRKRITEAIYRALFNN